MLQVIGLTAAEEEIYELLVCSSSPMTQADLDSVGPDLAQQPLADGLARLRELGLVSQLPGDPPRWSAVPPGTALEALIRQRGRALTEAARQVAELDERYARAAGSGGSPLPVEVVYGREAIIHHAGEIQRSVQHEIRACDAPPYPEDNPAEVNTLEIDHLRRGIGYRILYDRRAVDVPDRLADIEAGIAAGEQARVTEVPLKMTLVDDRVAVLPLRDPPDTESRLIVRHPVLLTALSALFELYWERALPLRVSNRQAHLAGDPGGPLRDDTHLLPLLIAGLADREIAAQLHLSERTIRSRVRAMLTRLHAATRFQAGYQAVRRGWLASSDVDA
jgi:sugar-specific transcriptional regulator TrmB